MSVRARHNNSAGAFIVSEEDAQAGEVLMAACTSRICARFS